jgi:hypothetical protein
MLPMAVRQHRFGPGNLAFMNSGAYMASTDARSMGMRCNRPRMTRLRWPGASGLAFACAWLVVLAMFWGSAEAHPGHQHAATAVSASDAVATFEGRDAADTASGTQIQALAAQPPTSAFRFMSAAPDTQSTGKQQGCPCGASCGCCTSASCGSAILGVTAPNDLTPRLASAAYSRAPSQLDGGSVDPMPRPPNVFVAA